MVQVNQKISKTAHIKELNAEIDRLKAELFATREKNGIYIPADQYEQREQCSRANTVRLEALEAELEKAAAAHKANADRLSKEINRLQQVTDAIPAPTLLSVRVVTGLRSGAPRKRQCTYSKIRRGRSEGSGCLRILPNFKSTSLICDCCYRSWWR